MFLFIFRLMKIEVNMKDSKVELHLDVLSVFWIITYIVASAFGFKMGTSEFGFILLGGTLCWLVIIIYRWWQTHPSDKEKAP